MEEEMIFTESETTIKNIKGGHRFRISSFSSFDKGSAILISSAWFTLSGKEWRMTCYPNGETEQVNGFVSLFLGYRGPEEDCRATWLLRCVNQIDPSKSRERSWARGDHYNRFLNGHRWGWQKFMKYETLMDPQRGFIKDDTIIFEVEITVHGDSETFDHGPVASLHSMVPHQKPLELKTDLTNFYNLMEGYDVRFCFVSETEEAPLNAHSQILSARSPVFREMFCGRYSESSSRDHEKCINVQISDIERKVFEAMLFYIYTGDLEEELSNKLTNIHTQEADERPTDLSQSMKKSSKKRKLSDSQDLVIDKDTLDWAVHLFAAADKYEIASLRTFCETSLMNAISEQNITELLELSYSHNATRLKGACISQFFQRSYKVNMQSLSRDVLVELLSYTQRSKLVNGTNNTSQELYDVHLRHRASSYSSTAQDTLVDFPN